MISSAAESAREVYAQWTANPPQVDGNCDDPAWKDARGFQVFDKLANVPIDVSIVYDAEQIYICTRFPDATEDRIHKPYIWDADSDRYKTGPAREDTIVLKWAMETATDDLTLHAERSYRADIWYWKASRTDQSGYADDKIQIYSRGKMPQSTQLWSSTGRTFYLHRSGDAGEPAYTSKAYPEFIGETAPKFISQQPSGSRADIQAKGQWHEGFWSVELARPLETGHNDDVQFKPDKTYLFGLSRYEIAGREPDQRIAEPFFGAGEITEHLRLNFLPPSKP